MFITPLLNNIGKTGVRIFREPGFSFDTFTSVFEFIEIKSKEFRIFCKND